jgi:hypothetical protein
VSIDVQDLEGLGAVLGDAFIASPLTTEPPPAAELARYRCRLDWWLAFATNVAADYQAQEQRHQKPPFLTAADGAYASRLAAWLVFVMRETEWRCSSENRAAIGRTIDGTATDADRKRVEARPVAPQTGRPSASQAPGGWPCSVACDSRVGRFYADRLADYRKRAG